MIIAFSGFKANKPVLEIDNSRPDQVVIRYISRDEHITIHLEDNGTLLRTHYYPDKPLSAWDNDRSDTAKALGLRNPQRHKNYIIHAPLTKIDNVAGYHLVDRLIDLSQQNPRQQYYRNTSLTIISSKDKFMLTMFLSTADNQCDPGLECVATSLGDICFSIGS